MIRTFLLFLSGNPIAVGGNPTEAILNASGQFGGGGGAQLSVKKFDAISMQNKDNGRW